MVSPKANINATVSCNGASFVLTRDSNPMQRNDSHPLPSIPK